MNNKRASSPSLREPRAKHHYLYAVGVGVVLHVGEVDGKDTPAKPLRMGPVKGGTSVTLKRALLL